MSGCPAEMPIIPRVCELHRVMADSLIGQPEPLSGDQIRFLRKSIGLAARKFAALLQVDPAHLSRVETGKIKRLGIMHLTKVK